MGVCTGTGTYGIDASQKGTRHLHFTATVVIVTVYYHHYVVVYFARLL